MTIDNKHCNLLTKLPELLILLIAIINVRSTATNENGVGTNQLYQLTGPDTEQTVSSESKKEDLVDQNTQLSEKYDKSSWKIREEMIYWANETGQHQVAKTHMAEVAACLLAKDEHFDILEWIAYHKYIGVGKFYIYDNNSVPPMIQLLRNLMTESLIEYMYLNDSFLVDDYFVRKKYVNLKKPKSKRSLMNSIQVWVNTNCLRSYHKRHKWMVVIDVDEFLVLGNEKQPVENPPNLPLFLQQYEKTGGLLVYRRSFGNSGHTNRPTEGVLVSYTDCTGDIASRKRQSFPKYIVNTNYFPDDGVCRVHECSSTRKMVNSKFKYLDERWYALKPERVKNFRTWDKILIHHYAIKSLEDFRSKQIRGMPHSKAMGNPKISTRPDIFFDQLKEATNATCLYAVQYSQLCCQQAIERSQLIYKQLSKPFTNKLGSVE
eukprot:TRINITY_DN766_c0_g1_i2.p1 TRINITY_DN766_c0_g1~~TRINITY_DN766_c0_g1_i2.p1  ORF type:complete len:433 (-),score=23.32 TRINITY_DN766_c0_g1_i2:616-1914(-)